MPRSSKKPPFIEGYLLKKTKDYISSSKKQIDGNLPTRTITSYVDLVDISKQSCCGYSYVLRLVDPIACLGHVMILKSKLN